LEKRGNNSQRVLSNLLFSFCDTAVSMAEDEILHIHYFFVFFQNKTILKSTRATLLCTLEILLKILATDHNDRSTTADRQQLIDNS
jgi:hypothetical protein